MISIHAPREGCDNPSTIADHYPYISIHAPREGCDRVRVEAWQQSMNFNPRTP